MVVVAGIDLAGSEKRSTGYCIISKKGEKYGIAFSDKDIIEVCKGATHIGIDAPLSLPKGRKCIGKIGPQFRECDLELRKLGIKFFPIFLGPMRKLTERGIRLKKALEKSGAKVYEVYPGATYDLFGISRKDKEAIASWIENEAGIKVNPEQPQDVMDAICAAITIKLFIEGKGYEAGCKKEGTIVLPERKGSIF
ncbi:MAG: DUF429 domain-containing protein [Candidatus Anstonellales archaeon]